MTVISVLLTLPFIHLHAQGNPGTTAGGNPGTTAGGNTGGVQNPLAFDTIQEFVQKVLEFLVMLATPFIIFMLIYTGFKFVMARGNPEALKTARMMFLWTIIGGMLILGAQIIASVIKGTVDDITFLNSPMLEAAVNFYNLQ